jgi:hypothetical protein
MAAPFGKRSVALGSLDEEYISMKEIRTISFVLSESHCPSFGTVVIGSVYPINSHQYLVL